MTAYLTTYVSSTRLNIIFHILIVKYIVKQEKTPYNMCLSRVELQKFEFFASTSATTATTNSVDNDF